MCWFGGGITMSGGAAAPAPGLGLLSGSMSVHMDGEPERMPAYRDAIGAGALPPGYAVDNGAALMFEGGRLSACVGSRPEARVVRVRPDENGGVTEQEMGVTPLPEALRSGAAVTESTGVSELRALRGGRHRWD
jgi:hypothetical protein